MVKRYYEIICAVMLIGVSMLGNAKEVHYTYGTETKSYWYKPGNKKWLSGDFNGDGLSDIAYVWNDNGLATIYVYINQSQALSAIRFNQECWATAQGGYWESQKWFAGDFNGDGRDDLAKVFDNGGYANIDVHLASQNNTFSMQSWAHQQGGFWDEQQWLAGDFNGDGRTDLAKAFNNYGLANVDVHLSVSGTGFTMQNWAYRQGGFWDAQKWVAGDFNGDGKDDIAKVFNDHSFSDIDVHLSVLDSHFSLQHWAYKQGGFWDNQIWKPIDINGDGASDFINIFEENDNTLLDLHQSSGSNFPGYVNLECDINPLQYSRVLCWLEGNFLPDTEGQREVIGVYMNMSVPAPFINFVIFSFD